MGGVYAVDVPLEEEKKNYEIEYRDWWIQFELVVTPLPSPSPTSTPEPVAIPASKVEDVVLPTSTPTPMPVRTWHPSSVDEIVCSYPWPQGCAYALAVVSCESSYREWVDDNWPYVGWWQIDVELHAGLIASMDYTREDMYHGRPNTDVAWRLSSGGINMASWPSCR